MKPFAKSLITFVSLTLFGATQAQNATLLKQQNLHKWGVAPANYSGIAHIEGNSYALVSDKEQIDGIYIFDIDINPVSGKVKVVVPHAISGVAGSKTRDAEGICFCPQRNSVFVSAEDDQQIIEYSLDGKPTGSKLDVPPMFSRDSIFPNCGFESLAYDSAARRFYTATERPLKRDNSKDTALVRILAFDEHLAPCAQYAYVLEQPTLNNKAKYYVHGVSEITALPDGRLVVMERELNVKANYVGSECRIRLFTVNPSEGEPMTSHIAKPLYKTAIADFSTHMDIGQLNYANYEGMCLGPKLNDGRQTLILINDSQAGAGNSLYRLKDYIKIIIL